MLPKIWRLCPVLRQVTQPPHIAGPLALIVASINKHSMTLLQIKGQDLLNIVQKPNS